MIFKLRAYIANALVALAAKIRPAGGGGPGEKPAGGGGPGE